MSGNFIILLFVVSALSLCVIVPILSEDELRESVYESKPVQWFIKCWNQFWK